MKKKNKKKYAFGGSIDPLSQYLQIQQQRGMNNPGNIPHPNEALAQNDIYRAQAMQQSHNSILPNVLELGGGIGMGIGMQGLDFGSLFAGKGKAAFGGVAGGVPIEAEGDEVVETPQGGLMELLGPSHEQGGIDMNLPEGSEIYSDRIKVDDKTMAQRKLDREKKEAKLMKSLDKNKTDSALKNALERTQQTNAMQDERDMQVQQLIGMAMEGKLPAEGGEVQGGDAGGMFPWGTFPGGLTGWDRANNINAQGVNWASAAQQGNSGLDINNYLSGNTFPIPEVKGKRPRREGKGFNINGAAMPTFGDIVGTVGMLDSSRNLKDLTLENRAGDMPNINAFEDYGERGLKTLEGGKDLVERQRQQRLQELSESGRSAQGRMRNSARGINTLRALDTSVESGIRDGRRQVNQGADQQLMQLMGQQAGMEMQADQGQMRGEAMRMEANSQDRDAFFNNLSRNEAGRGATMQNIGKVLNQMHGRGIDANTIEEMVELGVIDAQTASMLSALGLGGISDAYSTKPKKK